MPEVPNEAPPQPLPEPSVKLRLRQEGKEGKEGKKERQGELNIQEKREEKKGPHLTSSLA